MNLNMIPILKDNYILRKYNLEGKDRAVIYNIFERKSGTELNKDAELLVTYFTGEYSVNDIIKNILKKYQSENFLNIKKSILKHINNLYEEDIITFNNIKKKKRRFYPMIKMRGILDQIYIRLTDECNLKCQHCSVDAGKKYDDELVKSQIFDLIDQIEEMMVPSVTLTGGEPTLINYLPELINYASKKPMRVGLMTNGFLITKSYARGLVENGLAHVNISIDGITEKSHDNLRGIKGSQKKALNAIEVFKDLNIFVETTTIINDYNKNEIGELVEYGKRIGINNMKFTPIIPVKRGNNCDYEKSFQIFRNVKNEFLYNYGDINIVCKKLKEKVLKKRIKMFRCDAGEGVLSIAPNGDVFPCNNIEIVLGNIKKEPLYNIYNQSMNYKKVEKALQIQNGDCEYCSLLNECHGGCAAIAKSYSGSYNKCDPIRKEVILELIKHEKEGKYVHEEYKVI